MRFPVNAEVAGAEPIRSFVVNTGRFVRALQRVPRGILPSYRGVCAGTTRRLSARKLTGIWRVVRLVKAPRLSWPRGKVQRGRGEG